MCVFGLEIIVFYLEKNGTVGLLVQTSSDMLLLILHCILFVFTKTTYLNEEVKCTKPSP